MKKMIGTIWTVVCTVWASMAGALLVFAEEPTGRAAKVMLAMDDFQKVCLIIVIVAVALLLVFYIIKTVLKKTSVTPEEKEEEKK